MQKSSNRNYGYKKNLETDPKRGNLQILIMDIKKNYYILKLIEKEETLKYKLWILKKYI